MSIEVRALLVSVLALISSVALPLWFRRNDDKERLAAKRSLLLQKILAVKSLAYMSRFQLSYLLQRHGDKMKSTQRQALSAQLEQLEAYEQETWQLHQCFSNYQDRLTLQEIEESLTHLTVSESEVSDLARLIEDGAKSYQ